MYFNKFNRKNPKKHLCNYCAYIPGGPCKSTIRFQDMTVGSTLAFEKCSDVLQYPVRSHSYIIITIIVVLVIIIVIVIIVIVIITIIVIIINTIANTIIVIIVGTINTIIVLLSAQLLSLLSLMQSKILKMKFENLFGVTNIK